MRKIESLTKFRRAYSVPTFRAERGRITPPEDKVRLRIKVAIPATAASYKSSAEWVAEERFAAPPLDYRKRWKQGSIKSEDDGKRRLVARLAYLLKKEIC
jgi:hypothetical protein